MSIKLKLRYVAILMYFKRSFYRFASTNNRVQGSCEAIQPVVLNGEGQIKFGANVRIGVRDSPSFYNSYAYIEARTANASISFGSNVSINNQFTVVSESSVIIKDEVLIGLNCAIYDSNFHDLDVGNRKKSDPHPQQVIIERNVFVGSNVTILKGVIIGENSVVATGTIVTKSFPANVVIGGSPAKIIRSLSVNKPGI